MKISTTLVVKIVGGIVLVLILFLGGVYFGKGSGEREAARAWKIEKEKLLNKADSMMNAAKKMSAEADKKIKSSQEREAKVVKELAELHKIDSVEDARFKRDLRYLRSLINRPAKEIEDLMIKDYENSRDSVNNHR